ncbi:MAG: hypothetical protein GY854_22025 [Deltaproteobacteria bacterium]|nr:hypothetical protein [Deltaproteobacteria bacterium]
MELLWAHSTPFSSASPIATVTMSAYLNALYEEGSREDFLREVERQRKRAMKAEAKLKALEDEVNRDDERPRLVRF